MVATGPPDNTALASGSLFRRVTGWGPGTPPVLLPDGGRTRQDLVRWFDIGRATTVLEAVAELEPLCSGLTPEMVEDLLTPDDEPRGIEYGKGGIRLASAFDVFARCSGEFTQR